jgi:chromosome segregation protein
MLLKSLELQGYKTFAGRTSFEFAGSITCIVGPNGSGKSNIADAIRWVLGEQSYRLLRGKKTEDMIFSGSESRARAGMASTNIIFDNTSGWLPIDFSEVSITRRAYRDGNNEYLINGQRVRLKDISELLGSSGLSERTYTIIGQGLVDAALALRAEERRRLFEEAAGIGLYRSRREEAQRRLETTNRNLERVEDILSELKPRLRSLERQARRAAQFNQVEKDLKVLLRDYYGFHWYQAQRELNQERDAARVQEVLYEAVQEEQTGLEAKMTAFRDRISGLRARLGSWHRESSQLHTQREEITRELAVLDERFRSLVDQKGSAQDELSRQEQQISLQKERLIEAGSTTERRESEHAEAQTQVKAAMQTLSDREAERKNADLEASRIRKVLGECTNNLNRLSVRLAERNTQTERQMISLENTIRALGSVEADNEAAELKLETSKHAYMRIVNGREVTEDELKALREKRTESENLKRGLVDERSEINSELTRHTTQMEVLESAEKALAGYARGTQVLLKTARDGKLAGALGALSSQLDVPEEIENAIVAALGEYLDAVLLKDSPSSVEALDILLKEAVRGAILPINSITPPTPISKPEGDGILGVAADLVKTTPELRPAVDTLLGKTLVVRDRNAIKFALQAQPSTVRAVTLQGEVFYACGPITVGQHSVTSTISRKRQQRELGEAITKIRARITKLDDFIGVQDDILSELKQKETERTKSLNDSIRQEKAALATQNQVALEVERLKRQVQWQREQREKLELDIQAGETETQDLSKSVTHLEQELKHTQEQLRENQIILNDLSLSEVQSQVNYWNTQVAVAEGALTGSMEQLKEREDVLASTIDTWNQLQARIVSFDHQMENLKTKKRDLQTVETEVVRKIEALREFIDPAEAELAEAENQRNGLRDVEGKARQGLSLAYRRHSQAQIALTRKQEHLENLRGRIENDLGLVSFEYDYEISGPTPLPLGGLVESLPRVTELQQGMEETIKRQRAQVRRMGSINPDAQEEYKEVKERFEFMTAQVEDLNTAKRDINEVIAELDLIMEREFRVTFDEVAKEFREIFTRLFGGGSARLVLTDPDDLTETGIDIEARLPGRRTQGLSLLSGGERSLTATALVFSLLKVSPTPFCVLDEVDAMLDEVNVGRFRDLLRELAENTQFIVITHNRNTVQAADVIYGVTMGRDSASQMISLKLDEVAEVV